MIQTRQESYDIVVCGGGLAGFSAAVAAARLGSAVCLIGDRPVFGGNSSSEIRVTPHGAAAFHAYARETGLISELLIEERAANHETIRENGWTNSVWDLTLYDMAVSTPNLTFYLNTTVTGVQMDDPRSIRSLTARIAGAETELIICGKIFLDCTGDGVVADAAGCEWRWGSESREEFGEPHAPRIASGATMGSSIHFKARDMGRPVSFKAPEWAVRYEDPAFFADQGRHFYELESGYWWIEIGVPWNTVYDQEEIRHELTRHTLGIWDYIKNRDPVLRERAAHLALDWIGQIPGKRESRRIMGRYLMTEHDPAGKTVFQDEIAYGGWFIDLHTAGGLLAGSAEPSSAEGYAETTEYAVKSYCGPYGIPLRILIAKDVDNLMMAGRNVSVTHAALGTVRVMSTTALMGQAAGTAAAIALHEGIRVADVPDRCIGKVQQQLLRDGCFLPNVRGRDPEDLARIAGVTASSSEPVQGAGPEGTDTTGGFILGSKEERQRAEEPLNHRRGQWIAVGPEGIRSLSVCLSNGSNTEQVVTAELVAVDHLWDYRSQGSAGIMQTELVIPQGKRQWISWDLAPAESALLQPGRYVRLDLHPCPAVEWHMAGTVIPGHTSAYEMGSGRMRRYRDGGTLSFKVNPPQSCFQPENVLSGITRPYDYTNLWRSDPAKPFPQWVGLEWEQAQSVGIVEVTFPGHLFREYHNYPPFYRDPQTARDYSIEVRDGSGWREMVRVEGNYQCKVRHKLSEPVTIDGLRLNILATWGDPAAGVYEIRCYRP
ncbi:FAD-dependent oxidoreductase [Fontibacillus phaseoli]|uniref:FAD-dependent oxidoreductase n=1 Tax=Fontibacillus phaseoli TaxID=1416533 RepID=UPI001FEA1F65|nr:FAD-dependent oxidoreductase [Fontibacillus phaseoli]